MNYVWGTPITVENHVDPAKTVGINRYGRFSLYTEEHFWKIQPKAYHLIPKPANVGGFLTYSEREPRLIQNSPIKVDKRYDIVVERLNSGSNLNLSLFMAKPGDVAAPATPVSANVILAHSSQVDGPLLRETWTLDASTLEGFAQTAVAHEGNDLRSLYLVMRNQRTTSPISYLTTSPPPETYRIRVVARVEKGMPKYRQIEGDSNVFNPLVLRRYCSATTYEANSITKLEKNFDSFAVTESLSHTDADYFLLWMQEGEHLNVTYRGEIPAAIDAGGAQRELDRGMIIDQPYQWESQLNYIWDTWLTDNNKARTVAYKGDPSSSGLDYLATGWRPVVWSRDGKTLCDDPSINYKNCRSQFYAQRGYLWTFNEEPNHSNSIEITDDNSAHLTLTAYITGPYLIRVRGQGNEQPEPDGNLPGRWTQVYRDIQDLGNGNGSPYTLNFSFGVLPNRRRPHWQYLDNGSDPARRLACER